MRSNFPLILALFSVLTTVCESKHFCEAFVENGNKVDFVFRRMLVGRKFKSEHTDPNTIQYFYSRILLDGKLNQTISLDLIIKGQYWRLIMADPRNGLQMNFENNSYEGRDATFFNGFRMGADIPDRNLDFSQSAAVLFTDSDVTFGDISGDNHKIETDLNRYQEKKIKSENPMLSTLKLPNDTTLDFAFAPLFPPKDFVAIDFATKTSINGANGLKITRFGITGGLSPMATKMFTLGLNSTEYTIFKTFSTKYDIIGVHSMPDSFLDWTLFILFSDQKLVLFCMTLHDHISDYCGSPVELIDCYEYEKPEDIPSTTGVQNNEEESNQTPGSDPDGSSSVITSEEGTPVPSKGSKTWIWILLIVIIIIIKIVAIILIVWCFMKKREESRTQSNTNAQESGAASSKESVGAERSTMTTPSNIQTKEAPKSGIELDSTRSQMGTGPPKDSTTISPRSGIESGSTRSHV